jgi:hypothetical protein
MPQTHAVTPIHSANPRNGHCAGPRRKVSGSGKKVKSRMQAVAIAMSESGQSKSRKKAS